ncbi:MAG TPA: hypothetical protein VIC86_07315 [Acidimicrobiales bacterium]
MRDLEVPPPSASMDHFRNEVGRRAARHVQHRRRLLGGRIGVVLVLALGVSLLIVKPAAHTGTRASAPAARPSEPAPTSGGDRAGPGNPGAGASSPRAVPHFSPETATGTGCPSDSVCLDGAALETGPESQGDLGAAANAPGSPETRPAGAAATSSVSLPPDGVLRLTLRSSATEQWGVPKIASGTALRHRSTASGAGRTTTTEFVPAARSGSAVVSISCAGTGCHLPGYRVEVVIVP